MELNIYKDYEKLSNEVAEIILATVRSNPEAVLCLATGDTPRLTYQLLVKKIVAEQVDTSKCTFTGLDEWVGISPENEGSCHFFLEKYIFKPLNISTSQICLFDGMSEDLPGECSKMDRFIATNNGIDLVVVGVGLNGHIGFNEPGISAGHDSHVVNLDDTTVSVGQKYFTLATTLKQGITMGMLQVLHSKTLVMVANGSKKAEIMRKALEQEISMQVPASLVRTHPRACIIIDEQAAGLLNRKKVY